MQKPILILAGLLLLGGATPAQLRVDVRLVNVVVTVTDELGRYVGDLQASDFKLQEDGVPQQISHFTASTDLPVSVGVVLDSSISMERKISTATRAVDRFIRDIHPDDDIFLMTFDESVRLRQDFTSNRDRLWDALEKIKLGPGTSLYDGVIQGVNKLKKGKHDKKAILLISDGLDTTSERDFADARVAVRESEVLVYALGIAPDPGERGPMTERNPTIPGGTPPTIPGTGGGGRFPIPSPIPGVGTSPFPLPGPGRRQFPGARTTATDADTVDMEILETFADASGGRAWFIAADTRRNQLQESLDNIADELRSQYTIGYYPNHDLNDGKWHRIELTIADHKYNLRYRRDYLGK